MYELACAPPGGSRPARAGRGASRAGAKNAMTAPGARRS